MFEPSFSLMPFSTLLLNFCKKKQQTEECKLKLCGYIYRQGNYTHQAGTEKSGGFFLPFTGVSALLLKPCHSFQYPLVGC
jgi:hypothetical protein